MELDEERLIQLRFGRRKRVQLLKTSYERQVVGAQGCLLSSVSNNWIFCIPPGALTYEQEVSISFYHVTDSVGLDSTEFVTGIIEITPHQLNLSMPVELLLRHDLLIEDDSSKATVLYHNGDRDCETVSSLCQLSSTDESALTNDITATLWDDFVHIETSHVCRFGIDCEGTSRVEVWASLFAPECPRPEHFSVRLYLTSLAPQADDEDAKRMQTYGSVRKNEQVLYLKCRQQQKLQIDVYIPSSAEGWTVNDCSEFHQTFDYNDIKEMALNEQRITTDFWFSKGGSLVDVTHFAPFFTFNGCRCCLPPPASSAMSVTPSSDLSLPGSINNVAVPGNITFADSL